uniref:Sugar ABC transporter substrate-binding protein n=1 Tax=Dictyoglomus thermophilum TaxID=14 RepID=A0A7C3RLB9_DICTH
MESSKNIKFINYAIKEFIDLLASKEPAPGGGAAAALVGSIGVALSSMVANLTIGKEKFKDKEELMEEIVEKNEKLQKELLDLIEKDAEAFNKVAEALKLPKNNPEEKEKRKEILENTLKEASLVPLEVMKKSLEALKILENTLGNSNPNAVSDIGVSALCLKSAIQSAWLNVKINLVSIRDKNFVNEIQRQAESLLEEGIQLADRIYEEVESVLQIS